ncbi:MAG: hypothetical protein AAF184_15735 [Pseudomonadota bacterium]
MQRSAPNRALMISSLALSLPLATAAIAAEPAPDPAAPAITEFRANTFTFSAQHAPALAVADDGSFTVVWASRRQESGRSTVLRQRFAASGVALGEEAPLGLWRKHHLTAPVVDYADGGTAWAAWQSAGQDGDGAAIIARRFDAAGQGGSEILVNERTAGDQMAPVLAALADGGAVIAWTESTADTASRVVLSRLDRDGKAHEGDVTVDASASYRTTSPSLARGADGSVAVAYARFDGDTGHSLGVWLRILGADGEWQSPARRVGDVGAVEPVVAAHPDGFVIAWHANSTASDASYHVLAARLDHAGERVSPVAQVSAPGQAAHHNGAAVAAHADGTIAIAYNRRGGPQGEVLLRRFDAQLAPLDEAVSLTLANAGDRALTEAVGSQRLAFAEDGTLLAAWQGALDADEENGVGVTLHHTRAVAGDDRQLAAGVTENMRPYLPAGDAPQGDAALLGPQPHLPPTFGERPAAPAEREVLTSANGIGFTGVFNTGVTPPDPHLAVGPQHVVVIVNGEIAFYTKDGTRTFVDGIEGAAGFWGSVGASDFIFDPEALYDATSGRFIVMAAEAFAPGARSYVLVAVSDDDDPNGDWFRYRFETTDTSGDLFDSPNIGVTDDAVIITGDGFGRGAVYAVYAYDKASLLAGDPPAISRQFLFPTITQSAGFPRVTTGTGDTLYLVEHKEAFSNNTQVRVIAFSDLLGTPTTDFVDVTVPAYGAPEDPPQAGTTSRPETFDARFWSVDQSPDGNLWATHHINPDRVVARWYELAINGWPTSGDQPALVQSGDIDLGPDVRTYFSAINAGEDGSVAITYSRSSPSEFISMGSAYRNLCSRPGSVIEALQHQDTVGGYTLGRWGDYAAVQFDPVDPTVYWAHHEYAQNNSWRTWVQSVDTTTSCALADLNRDGIVNGVDFRAFRFALDNERCVGDWNRDGEFSQLDLRDFFLQWSDCRE